MSSFIKILWYKKTSILLYLRVLSCRIRTLPNFIIIGTARSGTTSLYNYLLKHPYIIHSLIKEVHFFDKNFNKGINWYKAFFPLSFYKFLFKVIFKREIITGEATPDYIYHPQAYKRIYSLLPSVKIIVLLRNPVDRAYSHYFNLVRKRRERLSFKETIEKNMERIIEDFNRLNNTEDNNLSHFQTYSYLEQGIYVYQIRNWLKFFPREQILIIKSEDLFEHPDEVMKKIYNFLNLPYWKNNEYKKYNVLKYQKMNPEIRKYLEDFYRPYNIRLYKFLGENFNWEKD